MGVDALQVKKHQVETIGYSMGRLLVNRLSLTA